MACLETRWTIFPLSLSLILYTGYKQESSDCEVLNGHAKEERDDSDVPSPPAGPGVKVHLTPLELEGLWNLVGRLEALPTHKKCVPSGIHNAAALLHDIRVSIRILMHLRLRVKLLVSAM